MDGFHIQLATLKEQQGSKGVYWRGAPQTFDSEALYSELKNIRDYLHNAKNLDLNDLPKGMKGKVRQKSQRAGGGFVYETFWPAFDHAKGDPTVPKRPLCIKSSSNPIVIVEGNYLSYWQDVRSLFDLVIFIDCPIDAAVERLKIRNQCIPGYTKEEIFARCEEVDRSNMELVDKSGRQSADMIVSNK